MLQTYGTENRTMDDTGLGNSHQDASLLFKNQKVFYENLIVSYLHLISQIQLMTTTKENIILKLFNDRNHKSQ